MTHRHTPYARITTVHAGPAQPAAMEKPHEPAAMRTPPMPPGKTHGLDRVKTEQDPNFSAPPDQQRG
jgi:hypothetical protein